MAKGEKALKQALKRLKKMGFDPDEVIVSEGRIIIEDLGEFIETGSKRKFAETLNAALDSHELSTKNLQKLFDRIANEIEPAELPKVSQLDGGPSLPKVSQLDDALPPVEEIQAKIDDALDALREEALFDQLDKDLAQMDKDIARELKAEFSQTPNNSSHVKTPSTKTQNSGLNTLKKIGWIGGVTAGILGYSIGDTEGAIRATVPFADSAANFRDGRNLEGIFSAVGETGIGLALTEPARLVALVAGADVETPIIADLTHSDFSPAGHIDSLSDNQISQKQQNLFKDPIAGYAFPETINGLPIFMALQDENTLVQFRVLLEKEEQGLALQILDRFEIYQEELLDRQDARNATGLTKTMADATRVTSGETAPAEPPAPAPVRKAALAL